MATILADRLEIPENIAVILWDMDGVLIDSLGLDLKICNELLEEFIRPGVTVPREYIQSVFAYDVPKFWEMILEKVSEDYDVPDAQKVYGEIIEAYEMRRQSEPFRLNPGIREVVEDIKKRNMKQAVVSNNPTEDVEEILKNCNLKKDFKFIFGNDMTENGRILQKKPAPDTFLFAAKRLGVKPENCAVIEDSLLGIQGGKAAGCYVVGVATGGFKTEELEKNGADITYNSFKL